MKTSDKTSGTVVWENVELGMMAGLWSRPDGGFEWRSDVTSSAFDDRDAAPLDPGPWLVARGEGRIRYPVLRRSALLGQFVRLAEHPTQDRILAFAERFGTLGIDVHMVCEATPGEHPLRPAESLRTWRGATHDFLDLWRTWREAEIVRREHQYRTEVVAAARAFLKDHFKSQDGRIWFEKKTETGRWVDTIAARDIPAFVDAWEGLQKLDPQCGPAEYYVHRQVNRQLLHKVNMAVLPFQRGLIRFVPETLLAAIYVAFARDLADALPIERACEGPGCHLTIAVTRRNRRYCSHACLERASYRRRRASLNRARASH